ncbi:MAG TPA: serine hydrolase domain-containing protein [Verrucomicrobiae bacterium]|nr:serine hydrolase domain-containing protein [Verrucomicrobiae bacterium]
MRTLDDLITLHLSAQKLAGLSLAVIDDSKIVKEQAYGFTENDTGHSVTSATLFQAGSISKPLAAMAALHLVEAGKLSLDEDVNSQLRTWKIPENEFTNARKVTLRDILSHSAGLTVHGFAGYPISKAVPTLTEILDGTGCSNSSPIRVAAIPGTQAKYSGGGYTVLQQLLIDVTSQPFPEFMRDAVLKPLNMTASTFQQPLPPEMSSAAATGHEPGGKAVTGRWYVYPQMAAAGLWTTASDLARFIIGIQEALTGRSNRVISQSMARLMLTRQKDNLGLGVFLEGEEKKLRFYHSGRTRGFDSLLMAYADRGKGLIILSNANNDSGAFRNIVKIVAKEYRW